MHRANGAPGSAATFKSDIMSVSGQQFLPHAQNALWIFFRNEHTIELNFRLSCMMKFLGQIVATTFCMERDDDVAVMETLSVKGAATNRVHTSRGML